MKPLSPEETVAVMAERLAANSRGKIPAEFYERDLIRAGILDVLKEQIAAKDKRIAELEAELIEVKRIARAALAKADALLAEPAARSEDKRPWPHFQPCECIRSGQTAEEAKCSCPCHKPAEDKARGGGR